MTAAERAVIVAQITAVFQAHASTAASIALQPVNGVGKLYELWVLAHIINVLVNRENLQITIANGNLIYFRQSPGPIDRSRSWLEVQRSGQVLGEIMIDVEFQTISYDLRRQRSIPPAALTQGDYHELDIALIRPGLTQNRPSYLDIILGAECKHTSMSKSFIRNVLGLRRELSFLDVVGSFQNGVLNQWPRLRYSNQPASALLLYCSDPKVQNYSSITSTFDISLRYLPI